MYRDDNLIQDHDGVGVSCEYSDLDGDALECKVVGNGVSETRILSDT